MYYTDNYNNHSHQNDDDTPEYHQITQNHYHQEQNQDGHKNTATHEISDHHNDQPPDHEYHYNDNEDFPATDY